MSKITLTPFEQSALLAQSLPAFPVNLHHIREQVEILLTEVGRYGFFDEYTDHSFKHVKEMLAMAEWIVPNQTKSAMTPAEYLLLVLGIYFHDVGLLIGRNEYENRNTNADFVKFRGQPIIPSSKYVEFISRLNQLPSEQSERIMYQEFVRFTHGKRIKSWIEGSPLDETDASRPIRKIIEELFSRLDPVIRQDLALLCESHTKDDYSDVNRYKISQPYGQSAEETVNLQYISVILRTVDLLQVTKGRAPSSLYQLINPTDPVSQIEWQKQNAVRSVRPKEITRPDDQDAPPKLSDTIEVHASFKQSDGFFGLTSYLSYANREISSCYSAIASSSRNVSRRLLYPWRQIDSSSIEATGFLTQSFEFSLDQQKILDLLTGHTLYNDTTVVLRELTQNALDAVRLQRQQSDQQDFEGKIDIKWDSRGRVLTVTDNGTGMSQLIIENHLLKVGSSRYQDPAFKEKYPSFSSISRFGIGVLSAFMVSDDVQITTCSQDDEEARRIELKSVHGKYLIKLLDKLSDRNEIGVFPHGTSVRIALRPTADIGDVINIAKMWLMFPRCQVSVSIDEDEPIAIGYDSPKDAIHAFLATPSGDRVQLRGIVEVREVSEDGVTLAYAVTKSELFKDWDFVQVGRAYNPADPSEDRPPIAVCIEGVGVEFQTPGFLAPHILAVSNAVGEKAPKTNVARSALEDTPELDSMLGKIYRLYAKHVSSEIERLATEESYSLSRAANEAPFIAAPLIRPAAPPRKSELLTSANSEIPLILAENSDSRINISLRTLTDMGEFSTVESPLSRSIETFVREAPSNVTASDLVRVVGNSSAVYPPGYTVCNFTSSNSVASMLSSRFEIYRASISEDLRRITLSWTKKGTSHRWLASVDMYNELNRRDGRFMQILSAIREGPRSARGLNSDVFYVPLGDIHFDGLSEAGGFISNRTRYLRSGQPLSDFFLSLSTERGELDGLRKLCYFLTLAQIVFDGRLPSRDLSIDAIRRSIELNFQDFFEPFETDLDKFVTVWNGTNLRMMDPFAWDRGNN